MSTRDASLPNDARLYDFRHYQSAFPLPDWGSLAEWKKERRKIRRHLYVCSGMNAQTEAFKAREDICDFANNWMLSTGVVEVPKLVGLNPQRVASWELEPLSYLNGFETVVLKR